MKKFLTPKAAKARKLEPVERMMATLREAGVKAFDTDAGWPGCLCALVLALEPKCRTYHFLESLPHGRATLDEVDVRNTLARLGYFSRAIATRAGDLDQRLFPALFVTSRGEPVILVAAEPDGRVRIFRHGSLAFVQRAKLAAIKGKAILFERYDENRPATSRFIRSGTDYGWFRALLKRFRGTFAQVLSAGLIINILSLTTPLMIMMIYNRVIATGTIAVMPMIVAGMVIAAGFEVFLRAVRSRGMAWIAARMDNIVGNRIFAHLVGLPPAMIERASVASQIARIKTFESIRDFFCGSVFLSLIELPFVALAAIAIYAIAGPLVLVPLAMGLVYALLFYILYKRVKISIRIAAKTSTARQHFTIEAFEKMRGIRAFGLTELWETKFRDLSGREMMAHFNLNMLGMAGETIATALTVLSAVATIGVGAHMIWAGTLSTGALVATMILVWRVITPFHSVCTAVPRLEQFRNSVIQINTLMDIETETQETRAGSVLPSIRGSVTLKNTGLRYGDQQDVVFSGLSIDARAGDLVAISGENGAGKTSLLKLIKGLYRPGEGSIMIDGFDIRQLDSPSLRRQIAYVPQQSDYFDGTILENLRLCNPLASQDDVEAALDLADASAEIAMLPDGLKTRIGRYAMAGLPGHLPMRLSLARLYLHTAPILLIDEVPNVILSGKAGANLRGYLARIKGSRTCFMVTYREDFIRMADTLIHLRRGAAPVVGPASSIVTLVTEAA